MIRYLCPSFGQSESYKHQASQNQCLRKGKRMRLSIPILLNILLVIAIYAADKYTKFKKLSQATKQIIIGIIFGGVSAFASSCGLQWLGTVVNLRASPLRNDYEQYTNDGDLLWVTVIGIFLHKEAK